MAQRTLIPLLFLSLSFLMGCSQKAAVNENPDILSMQTIDRNGFSETISSKDRLKTFSKVDFLSAQPYQKVLRVYPRNSNGQSLSRITSYHANSHPCQYLEVVEGRAHGVYKEWHQNGKLKIDAYVIEGLADVNEAAQASWLFDGLCKVYSEEGGLVAEFTYEKGLLQGEARHHHPNGQIAKILPYTQNELEGEAKVLSSSGELLESILYQKGLKHGLAKGKTLDDSWNYEELYDKGNLLEASYRSLHWPELPSVKNGEGFQVCFEKSHVEKVIEIHEGQPKGCIRNFSPSGVLVSLYHIQGSLKEGEETTLLSLSACQIPFRYP